MIPMHSHCYCACLVAVGYSRRCGVFFVVRASLRASRLVSAAHELELEIVFTFFPQRRASIACELRARIDLSFPAALNLPFMLDGGGGDPTKPKCAHLCQQNHELAAGDADNDEDATFHLITCESVYAAYSRSETIRLYVHALRCSLE